jgi:MFS family permease
VVRGAVACNLAGSGMTETIPSRSSTQQPLFTRRFVLAWLVALAEGMAFFLFIHLPAFLEDLGASEIEIGLLFAAPAIASILVRPWIGSAMDRRGRRPVIIAGNALNVAVIALYFTIASVGPWAYAVRIVHGVAQAMLFTALFTLAADYVPESRRTQGLAIFGVSGLLPIALGGLAGDVILAEADFDALFAASLLLAGLAFLLSLPLRDADATVTSSHPTRFRTAVSRPPLRPLWWMTAIFATSLAAYFTFLRTWVDEFGIGSVGLFFGFYAGTAILLRLLLGWLPDRVGAMRVLYPALGAFALGFVVLANATGAADVALAGVLCGLGHGFVFPILYGLVVTRARDAELGSSIALYTALFDVGTLVGGPLFGVVITLGGYEVMFLVAAALVITGALVFAGLERRRPAVV